MCAKKKPHNCDSCRYLEPGGICEITGKPGTESLADCELAGWKLVNVLDPTIPDIRHSKSTGEWADYLDENC